MQSRFSGFFRRTFVSLLDSSAKRSPGTFKSWVPLFSRENLSQIQARSFSTSLLKQADEPLWKDARKQALLEPSKNSTAPPKVKGTKGRRGKNTRKAASELARPFCDGSAECLLGRIDSHLAAMRPLTQSEKAGILTRLSKGADRNERRRIADQVVEEISQERQAMAEKLAAAAAVATAKLREGMENGDRTVTLDDGTQLQCSVSGMGPCLSLVMDTKTGKIFYGQNTGKSARNLSPVLAQRTQERISQIEDARKKELPPGFQPGWTRALGYPGSHSEVVACDRALKSRSDADLEDLAIYNVNTERENLERPDAPEKFGDPMCRCNNCAPITHGAIALTDGPVSTWNKAGEWHEEGVEKPP